MIQEKIPEKHQRNYWVVSRFLFIVIAVGGSYALLYSFTSLLIRERLIATGIIASGILTFALVAVYRDIGETQSEQVDLQEKVTEVQRQQKDIMANQEQWMRAGTQPVLSIDRWYPDTDDIIFNILNLGMGGAKDLSCDFLIYPPEESDIPIEEIELTGHLRDDSNARAISQSEDPIEFKATPILQEDYFEESGPFSSLSNELLGLDVVYSVTVSYQDLSETTDEIDVVTAQSTIDDEEMTIEGLILNTSEVYSSGVDVGPIDLSGMDFEEI